MLFHFEHLVLQRLDHGQIAVDDEVDDAMQDVVGSVVEKLWRLFELLPQFLM